MIPEYTATVTNSFTNGAYWLVSETTIVTAPSHLRLTKRSCMSFGKM